MPRKAAYPAVAHQRTDDCTEDHDDGSIKTHYFDEEEDYLDYLHMRNVKAQTTKHFSLADVKRELDMED